MTEWGDLVTTSGVIIAAGIAGVAANWGNTHRHSATKDALDILERLEGPQKEQWQRVVQGHVDSAERRSRGPSFMNRSLILMLGGYLSVVVADLLDETPVERYVPTITLAILGLVFVLMGLLGVFVAGFLELNLANWFRRRRQARSLTQPVVEKDLPRASSES